MRGLCSPKSRGRPQPRGFDAGACYFGRGASSVARTVRGPSRYRVATRSCTRCNKKSMEQPKNGSLSKTPGGAGHTRQTHEPHKHLITNPTHRLTRQTTPEPERTRRHKPPHTTHPIKRGGGRDKGGDGHTDAWTHPDLVLLCVNRVCTAPLVFSYLY